MKGMQLNMKIRKKTIFKFVEAIIFLVLVYVFAKYNILGNEEFLKFLGMEVNETENINNGEYQVTRVVDGDTIEINYNGTEEKVRLIGIDTPESVHPDEEKNSKYGEQASEYTKQLLEGKTVKLEFDVEERDSYGRLLAYVYVDDIMVNKKLLEEGLAQIATYPPNVKYVDEFTKIQEEARENKKGFWAEEVF